MSTTSTVNYENGQKLKGFRKQNNLSQAVIAEVVGKNYRTISNWESGRNAIPSYAIKKLNSKYNLNLSYTDTTSSKSTSTSTNKTVSKSVSSTKTTTSKSTKSSKIDYSSFKYVKSASVYTRFTNLRAYTNYSQSQFAHTFAMNPSAVSRYESGKMDTISFASLKSMIKAGIDLNSFFA